MKGPIERTKGTQATDVQYATAYLLATYLWTMRLDTNKVGTLPLSMVSLSEKGIVWKNGRWKRENTLQFMELLW